MHLRNMHRFLPAMAAAHQLALESCEVIEPPDFTQHLPPGANAGAGATLENCNLDDVVKEWVKLL